VVPFPLSKNGKVLTGMSWQATKWAKRQRTTGNLKLLLIVLADYAKKETGKSWHRQATLADDVGVSTRTIRRLLVQLREMGLIHTEPMKREWDGGNGNLMITLLMDVPDTPEISIIPEAPAAEAVEEAAPSNVARPHPADTGVRTPRTLLAAQEPSVEPSVEPRKKEPSLSLASEFDSIDDDIDQLFEQRFWPAYPKRSGLAGKPKAMTRFRKLVKAREDVEKIIDAAERLSAHWGPIIDRKPADARFIPMAVNWLKDRGWQDEMPAPSGGDETMIDIANHLEQLVRTEQGMAA